MRTGFFFKSAVGAMITGHRLEQIVSPRSGNRPALILLLDGIACEISVKKAGRYFISHDRCHGRRSNHNLLAPGVRRKPDGVCRDLGLIDSANRLWPARNPRSHPIELGGVHTGEL